MARERHAFPLTESTKAYLEQFDLMLGSIGGGPRERLHRDTMLLILPRLRSTTKNARDKEGLPGSYHGPERRRRLRMRIGSPYRQYFR